MSLTPIPLLRSRHRRLAVWWLGVLVFVQSMCAGILSTLGPSHIHRSPVAAVGLERFDLRRAPSSAPSSPGHVLTAWGHFHRDARPDRHHHRGDDPSVVFLDDPVATQADEAVDAAFGAALAAVGLVPAPLIEFEAGVGSPAVARIAWPALTHDPEPLERPPRSV